MSGRFQPKIAIVVITAGEMLKQCFQALLNLEYPKEKLELIVSRMAPESLSEVPIVNKSENCSRNRRAARERALRTDGEYFLLVDDDVIVPSHALHVFTEAAAEKKVTLNLPAAMRRTLPEYSDTVEQKHALGGYYPIIGTNKYVCGRWVGDNMFFNFTDVEPGLRITDLIGLGCAFISRRVLEAVEFEAGTNLFCRDAATGQQMIVGECGVFGNRVAELGVPMHMCGEVVCQHLIRAGKRGVTQSPQRTTEDAEGPSRTGDRAGLAPRSTQRNTDWRAETAKI